MAIFKHGFNPDKMLKDAKRPEDGVILSREQMKFIDTLNQYARLLDLQGLERDSWMVIAGGAVLLYQLRQEGRVVVDRVPTDLDITLRNGTKNKHILEFLRDAINSNGLQSATLITEDRIHHGHILLNPILETVSKCGLPVDLTTELTQRYPDDHWSSPGFVYVYPKTPLLLQATVPMTHPLLHGEIRVAHPGFIAYYKLMMARDAEGKQDTSDIKRMTAMGLLEFKDVRDMLSLMSHGDERTINLLRKKIEQL